MTCNRLQVYLSTKGTWRIVCKTPDPVLWHIDEDYLDNLERNVQKWLTVLSVSFRSGRVCAHCSIELPKKMRRCPCKGAYYCGRECQKAHWGLHKGGCVAVPDGVK